MRVSQALEKSETMFAAYLKRSLDTKGIILLRWLFSIGFFFLAITKGLLIAKHGLEPYVVITGAVGLPAFVSYYGVVAVFVELYLAVGLWDKKQFKMAILLAGTLTVAGIIISLAFLWFRISSDCGCGLLGDNEYGLLAQKIIIVVGLVVLYKNKNKLFAVD